MNTEYIRKAVEAALLAAGRSLSLAEIAQLFDMLERPDNDQLRAVLVELGESYADRGVELRETALGYRIQVRREFADPVSRLWPERPPRYSRALLETLAIIAYRQPLTRGEIEGVRGVAVNPNIIKTLFERDWIRVVGHREVPGRPELLGTTRDFLDYFGLKSLDQLPSLAALKSLEELDPQLALPEPVGTVVAIEGEAEAETGGDAEVGEVNAEAEVTAETEVSAEAEVESLADAAVETDAVGELESEAETAVAGAESESDVDAVPAATDEAVSAEANDSTEEPASAAPEPTAQG